jgi:hypothetical protein
LECEYLQNLGNVFQVVRFCVVNLDVMLDHSEVVLIQSGTYSVFNECGIRVRAAGLQLDGERLCVVLLLFAMERTFAHRARYRR